MKLKLKFERGIVIIAAIFAIAIATTASIEIAHINGEVAKLRTQGAQLQAALNATVQARSSQSEPTNQQQYILVTAILNNCAGQTDANAISICKSDLTEMYRWCLADNSLAACSDPRIADYLKSQS